MGWPSVAKTGEINMPLLLERLRMNDRGGQDSDKLAAANEIERLTQIVETKTATKQSRLESVWIGKDNLLLDAMFAFYAPNAGRVIDVCCNARRMWKGSQRGATVNYYDRDPAMQPDVVAEWHALPDGDGTVDVLVYDPPHLPDAAASPMSLARYGKDYGLGKGVKADNVGELHAPFLSEAKRVLRHDGLIFAKIKDYVHNHKYQWNLELFNAAVREAGLVPCDLIIKRDPCGGNLKSGRWQKAHHAKNTHCYWVVGGTAKDANRRRLTAEITGG